MSRPKIYLSWEDVWQQLSKIDNLGLQIYGVPTGGMILAGFLQKANNVNNPDLADVILDDVVDSGKTKEYYASRYPKTAFHACFETNQDKWYVFPWEREHPSNSTGENSSKTIEQNITRILQYIGEDVHREGLVDTPSRVVKSYAELFGGYDKNPEDIITTFDADGYDQIVLVKDIEFYSTCEHHMLPFFGKAHVAYVPDKKVIGLSKVARLVDIFARRLQIQERIGSQVTDALMKMLAPKGAACMLEAVHTCMCSRGVAKQSSKMVTSSIKGVFYTDSSARSELMSLLNKP